MSQMEPFYSNNLILVNAQHKPSMVQQRGFGRDVWGAGNVTIHLQHTRRRLFDRNRVTVMDGGRVRGVFT